MLKLRLTDLSGRGLTGIEVGIDGSSFVRSSPEGLALVSIVEGLEAGDPVLVNLGPQDSDLRRGMDPDSASGGIPFLAPKACHRRGSDRHRLANRS